MAHRSKIALRMPALALILALAGSAPSLAGGPPSFSFQAPDLSGKRTSSSPVLVVHAFSCHEPTDAALRAHAEGIVNGERQTIPLELESAGKIGVYNVARQWPAQGSWALVFSLDRGGQTTALVKLDSRGEPVFDAGPGGQRQLTTGSVRTISGTAKPHDIDTVLTAKAAR